MKAFLLAAGKGTRLRPITNSIPKCLVPVNEKPLMKYWFELFMKHGVDDILINLNHLPDLVQEFVRENNNNLKVKLFYESVLLGSLGTIIKNKDFYENENSVLIFYADNLTNINISEMINYHKSHDLPFTMGLFETNNPTACGIAKLNEDNLIIDFVEKPENPKSNLANAGIYIVDTEILNKFTHEEGKLLDIGFDLLPMMVNNMKGFVIKEFLLDIGTLKNYEFANDYVKKNHKQFNF